MKAFISYAANSVQDMVKISGYCADITCVWTPKTEARRLKSDCRHQRRVIIFLAGQDEREEEATEGGVYCSERFLIKMSIMSHVSHEFKFHMHCLRPKNDIKKY